MKHPILEMDADYYWCLHCETVYKAEDWAKNNWLCPGAGCDGTPLDCQDWGGSMARQAHPEYPLIPEAGKLYGLY